MFSELLGMGNTTEAFKFVTFKSAIVSITFLTVSIKRPIYKM